MAPSRPVCLLVLLALTGMALAGCVADGDDDTPSDRDRGNTNNPGEPAQRGAVSGVVSGLMGPMAGVRVDISNIFQTTLTDSQGRFSFDDLAPAQYRLTFSADNYRRSTQNVLIEGGNEVEVNMNLNPVMLTSKVPAEFGKQFVAVNTQDTLFFSVGLPGLTQPALTNDTATATFPGFWEIEPEPGYKVAQIGVVLVWLAVPELEQSLGLQYLRGESLVSNEIVEGDATAYHRPEPLMAGSGFAYYILENDDWEKWGDRNWQVGVYAVDEGEPALFGAAVEHVVQIVVTLVDSDFAAQY